MPVTLTLMPCLVAYEIMKAKIRAVPTLCLCPKHSKEFMILSKVFIQRKQFIFLYLGLNQIDSLFFLILDIGVNCLSDISASFAGDANDAMSVEVALIPCTKLRQFA